MSALWITMFASSTLMVGLATAPDSGSEVRTPVPFQDVTISGAFWQPRMDAFRHATLAANRHQCDITGRIANFERAAAKIRNAKEAGEFQGLLFNDSDVYKAIEGWSYVIATEADAARKAALIADLDGVIAKIAAAQYPDGYINTYYTLKAGAEHRFTKEQWDHETYCMGHLIEAGVAHKAATGKDTLFNVALKSADFLRALYGKDKFTVPTGHQELELALLRLATATGKKQYAEFAHELIEYRGRAHRTLDGKEEVPWGDYAQDHAPAAAQREAAGHAVRAGYMYAAMAELAAQGHAEYQPALDAIWDDITQRRMFITGGIGPSGHNEGFTVPYDIPIQDAYQETCASIAMCMWAHRMFLLEGNGKFMEQFERTLYNAALAGVSQSGSHFFYVNPMFSRDGLARQDWFQCACCPPNVLRFFNSLGQYIYTVKGSTVYVNLFIDSKATLTVNGKPVQIEQRTNYPFDGKVKIAVINGSDQDIDLAIRDNPGMGRMMASNESGKPSEPPGAVDGYGHMKIAAREGGGAEWEIPLPAVRFHSDPRVKASAGHVALTRGPLVYAAESADNGGSIEGLVIAPDASIAQRTDEAGVPTLIVQGQRADSATGLKPATIILRPYFTWANRGPGGMTVWFAETADALSAPPATTPAAAPKS